MIRPLALLAALTAASPAWSETRDVEHWLEMADACEALILTQSETAFEGYAPAPPILNVEGVREVAISHPTASLVANGAFAGQWFLCLVVANPDLKVAEAGALIDAWSQTQQERIAQPEFTGTVFDDVYTFDPVRVRCGPHGIASAVFAFATEGRFRVGVTNRLPPKVESPC